MVFHREQPEPDPHSSSSNPSTILHSPYLIHLDKNNIHKLHEPVHIISGLVCSPNPEFTLSPLTNVLIYLLFHSGYLPSQNRIDDSIQFRQLVLNLPFSASSCSIPNIITLLLSHYFYSLSHSLSYYLICFYQIKSSFGL